MQHADPNRSVICGIEILAMGADNHSTPAYLSSIPWNGSWVRSRDLERLVVL